MLGGHSVDMVFKSDGFFTELDLSAGVPSPPQHVQQHHQPQEQQCALLTCNRYGLGLLTCNRDGLGLLTCNRYGLGLLTCNRYGLGCAKAVAARKHAAAVFCHCYYYFIINY